MRTTPSILRLYIRVPISSPRHGQLSSTMHGSLVVYWYHMLDDSAPHLKLNFLPSLFNSRRVAMYESSLYLLDVHMG